MRFLTMRSLCVSLLLVTVCQDVSSKFHKSVLMNKIKSNVMRPVGRVATFKPVLSTPTQAPLPGRRHADLTEICKSRRSGISSEQEKYTPKVKVEGYDYVDASERTVYTVVWPHHIDRHHFEVTTSVPYLTVAAIDAIGYNPPVRHLDDCEMIYQEHMNEQYSVESAHVSQESLEMVRIPVNRVLHEKIASLMGDYD